MPERVELMQFWADLIDTMRDGTARPKRYLTAVA
jgi:hypothetical protein